MPNFRRRFPWIERSLVPFAPAISPLDIVPVCIPTIDMFGNEAWQNLQTVQVTGGLGQIELVHTRVPQGRIRYYASMEYWQSGVALARVRAGRVITAPGPIFPFAAFRDDTSIAPDERRAVTGVTVPPLGWIGVQMPAAPAVNLFLRVTWVETPLGEYLRLVQ